MQINKLKINDLRNHHHTELELGPGINHFYGLNGSGKTTILEAISILSFSKTFLPTNDQSIIRFGQNSYHISCEARTSLDVPYKVSLSYETGKKKKINSSNGDNLLPKNLIGAMPMVILTPDYKNITFGAPSDRRSFLDRILSQSNKFYLEEAIKLKKILRQRNRLLNQFRSGEINDNNLLEPWTNQLVDCNYEIVKRRYRFMDEIKPIFLETYEKVSESAENVDIIYQPYGVKSEENIKDDIWNKYQEKATLEKIRGTSLFGPQKDEIEFRINNGIAKEVASQGQHKSLLISLKIAEFKYLHELSSETPIILLDDIFSELDKKRASHVLELINENNVQTFITSTERSFFDGDLEADLFRVDEGIVTKNNQSVIE